MRRIFLIAAFTLLLPVLAMGQKNIRFWEKGPLTWSDFSLVNESIGREHSYLEFGLTVITRDQDINNMTIPVKTAVAFANKEMSWVDSNYRTPSQLRYNQVVFNIVELHRRRLQVVVDTGGNVNMDYYMKLLTYEVDSFCLQSDYGNDTAEVLWWEQEIRRQMDTITPIMVERHQKANEITGFRPKMRLGMYFGGGAKFFTGDIHRYFAPSGGFYFDVDGGSWRHVFNFGFYIGGGRCKVDTLFATNPDNDLYSDDKISTLDMHFDYGFAVIDGNRLTVTPFVGYGLQGFYFNEDGNKTAGGPSEGCWRLGIDAKYDVGLTSSSYDDIVSLWGCTVHGKVYVSFDKFKSIEGTPRGCTINAQLGIGIRYRDQQVLRKAVKK